MANHGARPRPARTQERPCGWRLFQVIDVKALVLPVEEIAAAIAEAVKGLRTKRYSWAEIGARLAISRQAAQQR